MPRAKPSLKRVAQSHDKHISHFNDAAHAFYFATAPDLRVRVLHQPLDLEETLDPPDLKHALADEEAHLENRPPLHAAVCGLSRVAVRAFTDDNIGLFVFYLGDEFGEGFDCSEH